MENENNVQEVKVIREDKGNSNKVFKKYLFKNGSCSKEGNVIYGLGCVGALIYFLSTSIGFWAFFASILKAFLWPAFVVFELMKFLKI